MIMFGGCIGSSTVYQVCNVSVSVSITSVGEHPQEECSWFRFRSTLNLGPPTPAWFMFRLHGSCLYVARAWLQPALPICLLANCSLRLPSQLVLKQIHARAHSLCKSVHILYCMYRLRMYRLYGCDVVLPVLPVLPQMEAAKAIREEDIAQRAALQAKFSSAINVRM